MGQKYIGWDEKMPQRPWPKSLLIYGIALAILIGSGTYFIWSSISNFTFPWEDNIGGGVDEDLLYLEGQEPEDLLISQGLAEELMEEYELDTEPETESELVAQERLTVWDRVRVHEVKQGESLWSIARQYNLDVDTLIGANELKSHDRINIGQKLTILPFKGVTHRVEKGESLWAISKRYNVPVEEIMETNNLSSQNIKIGEVLVIPGATLTQAEKERRLLIARGGVPLFIWPVTGRISSRFGMRWGSMHQGLDIAVSTGTPVRAAASGTITKAGDAGGYGLLVVIKHPDGVETRYGHNSKINVRIGQHVKQGDIIAYSGNTGRSTGHHVHFEIRVNGKPHDPLQWLN